MQSARRRRRPPLLLLILGVAAGVWIVWNDWYQFRQPGLPAQVYGARIDENKQEYALVVCAVFSEGGVSQYTRIDLRPQTLIFDQRSTPIPLLSKLSELQGGQRLLIWIASNEVVFGMTHTYPARRIIILEDGPPEPTDCVDHEQLKRGLRTYQPSF